MLLSRNEDDKQETERKQIPIQLCSLINDDKVAAAAHVFQYLFFFFFMFVCLLIRNTFPLAMHQRCGDRGGIIMFKWENVFEPDSPCFDDARDEEVDKEEGPTDDGTSESSERPNSSSL